MFEIKEDLTTDNILKKISEIDIFRYYCPNFKNLNEKFSSEFRRDSTPSCVISEYNGKLWYKDFGTTDRAIDCFSYVMVKHKMSFLQALGIINIDFNLNLKPYVAQVTPYMLGLPEIKSNINISGSQDGTTGKLFQPVYRNWLQYDVKYWKNQYYIDIPRAESLGIKPISELYIEGKCIPVEFPTYSYFIGKENGREYFKIYAPYSKTFKWLSNCKSWHYLGFDYLPWIGDKVVITKALKDIGVLSLFNLPAIAPQSESQIISNYIYNNLKRRFGKLYILYDNDKAGRQGAMLTKEIYSDITPVFIPEDSGVKDISDFIHKYRYRETHKLINGLFYEK